MQACRFRERSMIDRVSFDEEAATLCVSFRQTGKYLYYDVPAVIFAAMCQAQDRCIAAGNEFQHVGAKPGDVAVIVALGREHGDLGHGHAERQRGVGGGGDLDLAPPARSAASAGRLGAAT
jgi:hypothetical protein